MIASMLGSLILAAVLTVLQAAEEKRRADQAALSAKARRLRYVTSGKEVIIRPPVPQACTPTSFAATYKMGAVTGAFHIFLSHVWSTGQDQMRIVKQRLLEMLPDIRVFLDVDDLKEGKGAEYVDASVLSLSLIHI